MGGLGGLGFLSWAVMGWTRIGQSFIDPVMQGDVGAYRRDLASKFSAQYAVEGGNAGQTTAQHYSRRQDFIQNYGSVDTGEQFYGLSRMFNNAMNDNFSLENQADFRTSMKTTGVVGGVMADVGIGLTALKLSGITKLVTKMATGAGKGIRRFSICGNWFRWCYTRSWRIHGFSRSWLTSWKGWLCCRRHDK